MRLALVSLIAMAAAASAAAQPAPTPAPAPAPAPSAAPAPAAAPSPAPPPGAPAPAAAPVAGTSSTAPAPPAEAPAPAGSSAPTSSATPPPAPEAEAAPAPPPPPAPPTDPTAIAILSVLENVCIPAAGGGNLDQLAKAAGYRKSSDTWVMRTRDYTLSIEPPGSNPNQCHVDVTHPVDLEAPGRPIIVALHDWAAITRGWSLYRNDTSVDAGNQYTTRSWQLDWNDKLQTIVFTTTRKADGTPVKGQMDTSQLIYAVNKSSS